MWHGTQSHDSLSLLILFDDKLPLHRFQRVPTTLILRYLNSISLFNARTFKYFDFFQDQTPTEVEVVGCFEDDEFKELVVLSNLLIYSELWKSPHKRE